MNCFVRLNGRTTFDSFKVTLGPVRVNSGTRNGNLLNVIVRVHPEFNTVVYETPYGGIFASYAVADSL